MNAIAKACSIDGWMSRDEIAWLHGAAAGRKLVLEFGAWCGRSTIAMTSATIVVSVDTWRGSPEHQSVMRDGFDPFAKWRANTESYSNVQHFACDLSMASDIDDLVRHFGGQASMVFVDANHSEESVARDIETARKLLAPAGLLCGHDFGCDGWPGVEAAVTRLVETVGRGAETIWYESAS